MKKNFPLPLQINCDGFDKKLIQELADRLSIHFDTVTIFADEIIASKPIDLRHYEKAWNILDRFHVKVS